LTGQSFKITLTFCLHPGKYRSFQPGIFNLLLPGLSLNCCSVKRIQGLVMNACFLWVFNKKEA